MRTIHGWDPSTQRVFAVRSDEWTQCTRVSGRMHSSESIHMLGRAYSLRSAEHTHAIGRAYARDRPSGCVRSGESMRALWRGDSRDRKTHRFSARSYPWIAGLPQRRSTPPHHGWDARSTIDTGRSRRNPRAIRRLAVSPIPWIACCPYDHHHHHARGRHPCRAPQATILSMDTTVIQRMALISIPW